MIFPFPGNFFSHCAIPSISDASSVFSLVLGSLSSVAPEAEVLLKSARVDRDPLRTITSSEGILGSAAEEKKKQVGKKGSSLSLFFTFPSSLFFFSSSLLPFVKSLFCFLLSDSLRSFSFSTWRFRIAHLVRSNNFGIFCSTNDRSRTVRKWRRVLHSRTTIRCSYTSFFSGKEVE